MAFLYPLCHLWKSINLADFIVQPGKLRHSAVMARNCLQSLVQRSQLRRSGRSSCTVNIYCDFFFSSQATEFYTRLQAVFSSVPCSCRQPQCLFGKWSVSDPGERAHPARGRGKQELPRALKKPWGLPHPNAAPGRCVLAAVLGSAQGCGWGDGHRWGP